jgi:hypothetical protein
MQNELAKIDPPGIHFALCVLHFALNSGLGVKSH